MSTAQREIPFNYTSADDRQIVSLELGAEIWSALERLRERRVTGRSARLLMRLVGDLFILRRNPYLYQDLIDSAKRRRAYFTEAESDLAIVQATASGDADVIAVTSAVATALKRLEHEVDHVPSHQRRLMKHLAPIVGADNIKFDPFSLVCHATDATDWRLYLPIAVITPSEESQVAPLMATCAKLKLPVIPRGAGTGLTGGAVPLRSGCAMINTEKLNRIRGIRPQIFTTARGKVQSAVIEVEAGVITEAAMHEAAHHGWVFATDPTSAWACSVGGNIAENAGGKTAVQWGTAIDNVLSWRMAMPDGSQWTIRRVDHPLAKILHDETAVFAVEDAQGKELKRIEIPGDEVRKRGLGKDITNKALRGVPGLQKEGTDGVITSAVFVLHRAYPLKRTFCLEFYGHSMDEASEVIVGLSREFVDQGAETLVGLEHFDDEYVRAINYRTKAARSQTPKAVLLIDLAGHDDAEIERGTERMRNLLAPYRNTELFQAKDKNEATAFWADRKKLGAIAKRTNAFKLNEDIVLPLDQLADFARHVEAFNRDEERNNQREAVNAIRDLVEERSAAGTADAAKRIQAETVIAAALAALDAPGDIVPASVVNQVKEELTGLFAGWGELIAGMEKLCAEWRGRLVVIATHMHAGDGNVHVNVPVFSNDRWMMKRAIAAAENMMHWAVAHGGVVSGEHGIGITKFHHLTPERVAALKEWRDEIDPQRLMNPGKLEDGKILDLVFTPSFNLLELEARILQHGSLERLAEKISHCIRCGRCKPDCCVFHPGGDLFFHPRNKNMGIASLIEALLYDVQRRRTTRFEPLRWLREIADHCTICHRCVKPCPVDIDTGDVTILEREILAQHEVGKKPLVTRMTLNYLADRGDFTNAVFRTSVLRLGGVAQRLGSKVAHTVLPESSPLWNTFPIVQLKRPLAPASSDELFDVLPECGPHQSLVLYPANPTGSTVFYFPGCGSERLFSQVGKAALWLLGRVGVTVVLPPPRLCCGYPHRANAADNAGSIELRDTVLLSQIRRMMSHLTFDACVVSCGTCKDALQHMEATAIFDTTVQDVAAFVRAAGLTVPAGGDYLYHAPCHDSLDGAGVKLIAGTGSTVTAVPHCCSEAGTLALSRPDISGAMRERKREALNEAVDGKPRTILTNCPSCLQGLHRNAVLTGATPRHLAVELAERAGGKEWEQDLKVLFPKIEAVSF
jgi:D-lactate dehydrogenase (cytochrome)